MNIGTEYDVDYAYDTYGRFSTLTNGSDVYTYNYLANSNLLASINYPHDITATNSYEANRNLLTSIENKFDTTTISKYDYVNDALGRRTSMGKSGSAFSQNDTVSYGYNARSEVTSAVASKDVTYNYGYNFDYIGNRLTSTLAGINTSYTSNNLNQYLTAGSSTPTYDNDGNMLNDGTWTYTWNGNNRLIKAEKSTQKLEFAYDYMGRRVEKKVYDKTGSVWTLSQHEYFVYNSYKCIEKLNALDSNSIVQRFIWSGEKLLSMTDSNGTYYYLTDANKNIGQLIDASGNIVAKYEYSPFGKLTVSNDSIDNPFRFSSEYFDSETGLVYYNYRYYAPVLGRWLKRDMIEELGGINLYSMAYNQIVNHIDILGYWPQWLDNYASAVSSGAETIADAVLTGELAPTKEQVDAAMDGYSEEAWDRANGTMDALSRDNMDLDGWHGGDESKKAHTFDKDSREKGKCFAKCWEQKSGKAVMGAIPGVSNAVDAYDAYSSLSEGDMSGLKNIGSSLNDMAGIGAKIQKNLAKNKIRNRATKSHTPERAWSKYRKNQVNKARSSWNQANKSLKTSNAIGKAMGVLAAAELISSLKDCYDCCDKNFECPENCTK